MKFSKEYLLEEYIAKKRSAANIAKEYSVTPKNVCYWLKKHNISARKNIAIDLTNQKFGNLTVISRDHTKKNLNSMGTFWLCKCSCGNDTIVKRTSLIGGFTKSCGCFRKNKIYKGYESISGVYFSRLKKGAGSRDLKFDISIKDLWDLFIKQKKLCALTKIKLNLVRNYTKNRIDQTASLDRIDNQKGYVKNNIHWVHKDVNIMKGKLDVNYFIEICIAISNNCSL